VIEEAYDTVETRASLELLLGVLCERDRSIVRMRYFDGLTQAEIGARIGVTQMQVSRLLTRILRDLRNALGRQPAA
jgi:RNA polymerase sigma-B factor